MLRNVIGIFAALFVAILCAAPAAAHDRTVSYSTWEIDGARARITARLTPLDVSRFPWAATAGGDLDRRLGAYLSERLTLRADGVLCPLSGGPTRQATSADRVVFSWEATCPSAHALQLRSELLLDLAPTHLHFARLRLAGQPSVERVLSDVERTWTIGDVKYLVSRPRRARRNAPMTLFGTAEEIAELMAFLVSPGARWMTGSALRMDGGEVKSI